jgi:phosphatidate cytidylyltransferase
MNQNLKLRIITALIGVSVILCLLLWMGVEGVALFAWVVSSGMLFEYSKLFFKLSDAKTKTVMLLGFNSMIHALNYWFGVGMSPEFLGLAPVFLVFVSFLFMVPRILNYSGAEALNTEAGIQALSQHVNEMMAMSFGFIYCGWFPLLMVDIRQLPDGKHWLLLTLIIVWSSDTFAYFAGRFAGKNLLYQTVSPKKTWEGAIGGSLGAVLLAVAYAHFFIEGLSSIEVIVIALTVSVAAALGDLCESLIKRAANVKDSGSILPGHGGFLDRFDGVVLALPVMYAFLWLIF